MEKKSTKEFLRALKFLIISISAGIVQIGSFTLFSEAFIWNYWVAYLISLLLSIIWNFTINRKVTFKAADNYKKSMLLILAFYAVFTPVSTVLGNLAETNGVNEYLVLAITMVVNFLLEFVYCRYVVYRKTCDTMPEKKKKEKEEKVETVEEEQKNK
jgi:putative flippase GtrA